MAGDRGKLTDEQRAAVRARWEGCDTPGHGWLAKEASFAFGVSVSRQGMADACAKGGWKKGGPPSLPLSAAPLRRIDPPPASKQASKRASKQAEQASKPAPLSLPAPVERVVAEPVGDGEVTVMGRPTKYRPEFDQRIVDFFKVSPTEKLEVTGFGGTTKFQIIARIPPTLVRFAEEIGVSIDTLGRWATDSDEEGGLLHPTFAAAYARARKLLESLLLEGAAVGVYNERVIQFTLKNWYGWKDQPDRDVVVQPVSRELLETRYINIMTAARERQRLVLEERARLRLLEAQEGQGGVS